MAGGALAEAAMTRQRPWAVNPSPGGQAEGERRWIGRRTFAHVLPFRGLRPTARGRAATLLALAALGLGPAIAAAAQEPVPPIQPDRPGIADGSTVVGPAVF